MENEEIVEETPEETPEVTTETPEQPEVETETVAHVPQKFRKEIQPVDDDGKPLGAPHVYEADSQEELLEKMAAGIANGTKKIHQLNKQVVLESPKAPEGAEQEEEAPVWKPRALTEDEKFLVKTDPEQAYEIMFKAKHGCTPEEYDKRRLKTEEDARIMRDKAETEDFKDDNPDFFLCNENRDAMIAYMQKNNLKWRKKNLGIAFRELSESGLLRKRPETKVNEAPVAARTEPEAEKRPANPFPRVIRNAESRAVASVTPKSGKLTAEEEAMLSPDEYAALHPELRMAR